MSTTDTDTTPPDVEPGTAPPPGDDAGADTPPAKARRRSGTRRSSTSRKRGASSSSEGKADASPKRPRSPRRPAIAPRMAQLYVTAGVGASMVPHPVAQAAGVQLVTQADECGKAWEALAKEDPRIADALDRLLTASAYGSLLAAHLPILLAALVAGGKIPPALGAMMGATAAAPAPEGGEPPAPGAGGGGAHLVDVLAGQNAGGRP